MRRILCTAAAVALAATAAPAHAAAIGTCTLAADNGYAFSHAPSFRGVLSGVFVDDALGFLDVRCSVEVNGAVHGVAWTWGTGVVAPAAVVRFWVDPADDVRVCTEVNGAKNCSAVTIVQVPAPVIHDALDLGYTWVVVKAP